MSYLSIAQLTNDPTFSSRSLACATQQAETYKDDQRPDFVAVAESVLRGESMCANALNRLSAAGPGIGDKADNGDGTIDQSNVTDADLLSLTQANWQVAASLFFASDGTPIGGT
jgi:hypothetical protein